MPIKVLVTISPPKALFARLEAAGFELHRAETIADRAHIIAATGPGIRAVITNGSTGFTAAEIAAMPALELICAVGVGYENINLAAARARGIVVTHGPGTNATTVADHAFALLMAVARGIVRLDAAVRRGEWDGSRTALPKVSGKKLGILGLGMIGEQIARRGALGFDMEVAYHSRTPRADVAWPCLPSVHALAEWADFLVVATPGGPATRHLVDASVLAALGPQGFLINIARGSVVDTQGLIEALTAHRIAGAALDVVEGEPAVPPALASLDNVIFTPPHRRPLPRIPHRHRRPAAGQPRSAFRRPAGADAGAGVGLAGRIPYAGWIRSQALP